MKIRERAETYTPAARVRRSFPRRGSARAGGGGGGQIKLRREIYGRTCNEQLFHGMRTPGLASGGGISIRSSSCRPRARGPRPLLRVALPSLLPPSPFSPESFIPRKKKDSSHILPQPPSLPPTRKDVLLMRCTVITLPKSGTHFPIKTLGANVAILEGGGGVAQKIILQVVDLIL